jgi:hypothetical protein
MTGALRRLDARRLAIEPGEILCIGSVRNEALRLPLFLDYYRRAGIDRFLIVDNDSTDGTTNLLLDAEDVHVFHTRQSYAEARCGLHWVHALLDTYAIGHWTLTVDVDELLIYPGCEDVGLRALTSYLDRRTDEALLTFLLDMYSARPIRESAYRRGRSFLDACPYFDADSYVWDEGHDVYGPVPCWGGPRARLFWAGRQRDRPAPFLPKIPLVRWRTGLGYVTSTHILPGVRLGDLTGALLHFKFFSDFGERAAAESRRGQHWENAGEYRVYDEVLQGAPELTAFHEGSVRYQDSRQLVALGLLRQPPDYPSGD